MNEYFVTPEDFGCIAGDSSKAELNSKGLQKMVDYAIANGQKITANANRRYYISKSIVITAPIIIDFNHATLVATDTASMVVVNDGKGRMFSGRISGICLDLNKISKAGIKCVNSVKLHVNDCWIKGIPNGASGFLIEKGYEVFVNNMHIEGGENGAIGMNIRTHDCHFTDCAIIDCHTAVICCGVNFFERIHAWMGYNGRWLEGSTFFRIATKGPVFLDQCFSDTFDKGFQIDCVTNLYISQFRSAHNKGMWRKDVEKIHPVVFNYKDLQVAKQSNIVLDNSYIDNLVIQGKDRQRFSNIPEASLKINNSRVI